MRAVSGTIHANRRKKVLKRAKGFIGGRSRLYRTALSAVMKAGMYAYRDRKQRKRQFRSLWIARINAGARQNGLKYSQFIHLLAKNDIKLNRKVMADLAMEEPESFAKLVEAIKA